MVRRSMLVFAVLALLTACGGQQAAPPTAVPTESPAPAATPEPIAAPAAETQGNSSPPGPITVEHSGGTLTLDQPAARVVACSEEAVDFLVALGVQAVGFCSDRSEGATSGQSYELPHFFPRDMLGSPVFVGSAATPSAELIATLKPDLIISTDYTEGNEQLAQIAPTFILSVDAPGYWRETLGDIGKLVGRSAEAAAFLAEYDATVERLAAQTAPIAQESPNLLLVYSFGASEGTMLLGNAWTGSRPFTQLGFTVLEPEGVSFANGVAPISAETVAQADADIIFVLRPELADGTRPSYPLDALLAARDDVRVVYQVFPSTRGSTAPYTDRFVLEEVGGLLGAPAGQPAADAQASGACPAGSRPFDHELLATEPVCIPADPQRIIALDMASVELTLLADKTLAATSGWILSELPLLEPAFAETLATVEDVGYPANLEKVLALKPDLILAVGGTDVGETIDVEQARQIAPVVIADPAIYSDWKLGMEFWSAALNVPDLYTAMEANYRARVSELQVALGDARSREVSVIATSTYGYSLWMPDTPPGAILSDVGLARPEAQSLVGDAAQQRYQATQYISISEERLDLADGDVIFFFTYASSDPATAEKESAHVTAFTQKPIWRSLGAVKAGQAFLVPEYWWRSQTYLLANKVLDDLFTHLTDTQATTPVLDVPAGAP